MRRLCTERERKILKQNWKNISTDFAAKSAHFRMGDAFLVVLFWMITCFPHPNAAKMVKEVHTLKGVIIMGKK